MKSADPVSEYLHTRCSVYFRSGAVPGKVFTGFGAALVYVSQHMDAIHTADIQVHTGDMVEPFYEGKELMSLLAGSLVSA